MLICAVSKLVGRSSWIAVANREFGRRLLNSGSMDLSGLLISDASVTAKKLMGDYTHEPARSTVLVVNSDKPFNAETSSDVLVREFITPTDFFYVRNHGAVPELDASTYKLQISCGSVTEMSLQEIKGLAAPVTVDATLMCAGNRRNDLKAIAPVKGVGWENGAIGNGSWTGIRLRDLLLHVKAEIDNPHLHVEFVGEEDCEEKTKYGSSIPMSKAADPKGDVLLAWEMNGKPLTRDHGFPLRVVVPGYIGARSVKWLKHINISPQQSQYFFQQRDYKLFLPTVNWDNVDSLWESTTPLSELSVQSAICEPVRNQIIPKNSSFQIKGYALSNGKRIMRVDVSLDNGETWQVAKIVHQDLEAQKGYDNRYWSWSIWSLQVDKFPSPCTIVCRAWDVSANTQPEEGKNIWNLRGVMNNAWHRVNVSDS